MSPFIPNEAERLISHEVCEEITFIHIIPRDNKITNSKYQTELA